MDSSRYLDLLFDGYSKTKGAYQSRRQLADRTLVSFFITLLLFMGALYPLVPEMKKSNQGHVKTNAKKIVQYAQLAAPPPIDLIEKKPPKPKPVEQKIASKKFVKPTVKPDDEIDEEEFIPSQEELKYINPGTKDQEGDSILYNEVQDQTEIEVVVDLPEAPEPEPAPAPAPEPVEEQIYNFTQQKAAFSGGMPALYTFLSQNLQYPLVAQENNITGRVIVQFVVEKDGSITQTEILRDIGGGCGAEAVRVVNKMPTWTPAEQNGIKVRCRYTLPVTFTLEE